MASSGSTASSCRGVKSKTHVLTHALHYGSAVFEGERIYDGRVFRLAAHSARLRNSARLLDYELPWTREQIDEATRAVVKANNLSSGYVRPIAWRGSEVMGVSAIGTTVHLAIAPWAQEGRLSVQAKPGGINVTMAKYRRPSPEVAPGEAKVAGLYIICGIEKDRALKAGFDDALMLDWQGRLAESTGANIFLAMGGKLVTPKPENFLDGITRRAVMGMAASAAGRSSERAVMPEELAEASEVFLCGTAAEIVPVGAIDERRYQVGPMTRTLMEDFKTLVRQPDCEGFGESAHLPPLDRRRGWQFLSTTSEGCPVSAGAGLRQPVGLNPLNLIRVMPAKEREFRVEPFQSHCCRCRRRGPRHVRSSSSERGLQVEVVERGRALGDGSCSWMAGGMLAPWCERATTDEAVADAGRAVDRLVGAAVPRHRCATAAWSWRRRAMRPS